MVTCDKHGCNKPAVIRGLIGALNCNACEEHQDEIEIVWGEPQADKETMTTPTPPATATPAPDLDKLVSEFERLRNAARPGPWRAAVYKPRPRYDFELYFVECGPADDPSECFDVFDDPSKETAEFVAFARSLDLLALLATAREMRASEAEMNTQPDLDALAERFAEDWCNVDEFDEMQQAVLEMLATASEPQLADNESLQQRVRELEKQFSDQSIALGRAEGERDGLRQQLATVTAERDMLQETERPFAFTGRVRNKTLNCPNGVPVGWGVEIMDVRLGQPPYPIGDVVGFSDFVLPHDCTTGDILLFVFDGRRYVVIPVDAAEQQVRELQEQLSQPAWSIMAEKESLKKQLSELQERLAGVEQQLADVTSEYEDIRQARGELLSEMERTIGLESCSKIQGDYAAGVIAEIRRQLTAARAECDALKAVIVKHGCPPHLANANYLNGYMQGTKALRDQCDQLRTELAAAKQKLAAFVAIHFYDKSSGETICRINAMRDRIQAALTPDAEQPQ